MSMNLPDITKFNDWAVEEIPTGFVAKAGVSAEYVTGGWRSMRPVWNAEKCTSCMLCWVVCPDSSVIIEDGKMAGIDYDHCKGCGVCVKECRFGCLEYVREDQAKEA